MSNDLPTNHYIKESISFAFTIVLVNIKDTRYTGFYDKLTGNCKFVIVAYLTVQAVEYAWLSLQY